jgi:hypothetical protein
MVAMRRGDFSRAWTISDAALGGISRREWERPRHQQRIWRGQPLDGQRVLIRCYHGLGDTVQFLRYLPAVAAVASHVTVWIQAPLIPLVAALPRVAVLPLHDGIPRAAWDVDVEIMELPHVFRTTPATIPLGVPYLRVPGASRRRRARPRVGLAWRAGEWNSERSMPVESAASIVAAQRCDVVPLVPALRPRERTYFESPGPGSIPAVARVIRDLDLLITVDTVFAHLGGALGRPTWLLLHHEPDWRWMLDRDDSPWYPSMRLFRQPTPGSWDQVASRAAAQLTRWLEEST